MHFEQDRIVRAWSGAEKFGLFIQIGWSRTRGRLERARRGHSSGS